MTTPQTEQPLSQRMKMQARLWEATIGLGTTDIHDAINFVLACADEVETLEKNNDPVR